MLTPRLRLSGAVKITPPDEATPPPQSEAKAEPKPADNTDVTKLMNTTLGDVLLAGILKDSESAGRIIAEAITDADAPVAAVNVPEIGAEPNSKIGSLLKVGAKATTPLDLVPKIIK
jgi:hypothetical protein